MLVRRSSRFEFTLDRETVARLRALCEAAGFTRLRDEYVPPGSGADLLEHVVTYRGRTVRAVDGAVPAELQPLLEALAQVIESRGP